MLGEAAPRMVVGRRIARPALDPTLLRQLAVALVAAALLETALLRLVTRIGVHLPKEGGVSSAFEAASLLGSLAFNFASVLAIALAVVLLGAMVLRMESGVGRLTLAALSLAMLWGLGLSLATDGAAADALFGVAVTLLVGLVGLVLVRREEMPPAGRLAVALMVIAYFCYQYYALTLLSYRLLDYTAAPPLGIASLRLGEGLVVAAGGAVFWAWGVERWRRVGLLGLVVVAVLVVGVALGGVAPASTMSILALWTTGLSLFLPFPLYLVALGLYLVTLVACWRSGDAFWTAAGLLLLLLAGYMPETTYQHLLLLLGVGFLSGAARWAVRSPAAAE